MTFYVIPSRSHSASLLLISWSIYWLTSLQGRVCKPYFLMREVSEILYPLSLPESAFNLNWDSGSHLKSCPGPDDTLWVQLLGHNSFFFLNKNLLEHNSSYSYSLTYCCGCFHTTTANLSSCYRDHMSLKTPNICCLVFFFFQNKSIDPWSRQQGPIESS